MDGRIIHKTLVAPEAITAGANGDTIDLQGLLEPMHEHAMILLQVGEYAGTTPTLDVHLESSPNGSTWTDITDGAFTQVGEATGDEELLIIPPARYIRAVYALTGSGADYTFAVTLLGFDTQA